MHAKNMLLPPRYQSRAKKGACPIGDQPVIDLGAAGSTFVIVAAILAIVICLIPALVQAIWQVLPGILLLWLVLAVLQGMVKRLLG